MRRQIPPGRAFSCTAPTLAPILAALSVTCTLRKWKPGLGGDEGRLLLGRFRGVLPLTLQRFGALGGQPGVSTPNCFAYSAFHRCQPPNFMASAPTDRK